MAPPIVFTIGHSRRKIEDFKKILEKYGVQVLVDIRRIPRSRTNPQFNDDALSSSLRKSGIKYIHIEGLGGHRRPVPNSVNMGWRNDSFRGYADYMQTDEFSKFLDELISLANSDQVAIMCAEAVPWRCHRSLVADALVVRGFRVVDILDEEHSKDHTLTQFARVQGTGITYPSTDAGQTSLI